MRRLSRRLSAQAGARAVAWADGRPVVWVRESHALEPVGPRAAGGSDTADDGRHGGDLTGLRIWEAAPLLIAYLGAHRARLLGARRVIELGSGSGSVGLAAAAFGAASVALTDAETTATVATALGWQTHSTLAQLRENVALNPALVPSTSVAELRWGDRAHVGALVDPSSHEEGRRPFDTVLASDVLYYPSATYARLAATIDALVRRPGGRLAISYKVRHGSEGQFFDHLTANGDFSIANVEFHREVHEAHHEPPRGTAPHDGERRKSERSAPHDGERRKSERDCEDACEDEETATEPSAARWREQQSRGGRDGAADAAARRSRHYQTILSEAPSTSELLRIVEVVAN